MKRKHNTMKRSLHACLLGLMTLAALPAALAKDITLDFENMPPGPLLEGDTFDLGRDIYFEPFSVSADAQAGDLVGAVIESAWAGQQCGQLQCPGTGGNYLAALNDGALYFSSFSGGSFGVKSLKASFLGPYADSYPSTMGMLAILGYRADGSYDIDPLLLGPPGPDGYAFSHFDTDPAFAAQQFAGVYLFGLACDSNGLCSGFDSNRAQFALDDLVLTVAAVPEPATWLLLASGLPLIAARRRRA